MKFFHQLSIRKKLITMMLSVAMSALLIGFGVVIFSDIREYKVNMSHNTVINAQMVGEYSVSPLAFGDQEGAKEVLEHLSSISSVSNARLYDSDGVLFASYDRSGITDLEPPDMSGEFAGYAGDWLHVVQQVVYRGEHYGTIYLRASTEALADKIRTYIYTMLGLMLTLGLLSYYLARRLQGVISEPLYELARVTHRIREEENYSFRVTKRGDDEIGMLYDAFNNMMERIWNRRQERDRALQALFDEKERAQVTLQSIGDGVVTTDTHGVVQYLNTVAEKLTGWRTDEAEGLPLEQVFKIVNEITREETENPVSRCLREQCIVELANHTVLICKDGREVAIEDSAAPIRNQRGVIVGVVLVFHDVTASRKLSQQLAYQARHDALTGLINRREFEERLNSAMEQARMEQCDHALLYMDLDQFKVVNDTCGHVAGDELLRQVTSLLQTKMRRRDTLARLGGDEFAVLLEYCAPEEARHIAEHLCEAIQSYRFVWEDKSFGVGVSIGLVPINKSSEGLGTVLSIADSACYSAKEAGRNRIHSFEEDGEAVAKRHGEMQWVSRITRGLESNAFTLYMQKIAPIAEDLGQNLHYEVLIRMKDEFDDIVMPNAFLPAAERYNLMPKIDRWVVEQVFSNLSDAKDQLDDLGMCSINLSGHSVGDERFLQFVIDQLDRTQMPPHKVCFEITETATIVNLTSATRFIRALKKKGCRFALDDFGSGMSSFLYLKNLPVDFLKIDGGFVKDITHDPMDFALVKSINDIGHVMGMRTIAEFVENEEVLEKLREMGVDYAQGYFVGRPVELFASS